jgi:HD superfamily phosphodiesterase
MEQFGSGLVAGISVPNTPIIADALAYAQRLSEPYLFNHAVRSWLFAISIARAKNIDCDPEVVAIGTILHDIGLTDSVMGPKRFEVNGADAARAFVAQRGLSDRRAQLIWDLVALNSTVSIALYKEPEVAVGTRVSGWTGEALESTPSQHQRWPTF